MKDVKFESFDCNTCGKNFKSTSGLRVHKLSHLEDEDAKRPYKCETCGKGFASSTSRNTHTLIHLPDGDPRKKTSECNVCRKRFTKEELADHKSTEHGDNAKTPFKCAICGNGFARKQHLERHEMETHLPDDDPRKKTECDVCGKLVLARQIDHHKQIHLDEKDPEKRPFKCDLCGLAFRTKYNLRNHMNIHTGFPFKCVRCYMGFTLESTLKRHDKYKCKPLPCSFRPRSFMEKIELEEHMNKHKEAETTAPKNIPCDVCGQKLSSTDALAKHKLSHLDRYDDQYPCECEVCLKRCRNKAGVNRHKRLYHPESAPVKRIRQDYKNGAKAAGSKRQLEMSVGKHQSGSAKRSRHEESESYRVSSSEDEDSGQEEDDYGEDDTEAAAKQT